MGTAPGAVLRQICRERPLLPAFAAELFVERLRTLGPDADAAFPMVIERKRDTVAAALRLVLLNADMLETVRDVLVRSDLPVPGASRSPEFLGAARDHLLAALRDVADDAYAGAPEGAWAQASDIVIGAIFGGGFAASAARRAA